MIKHGMFNTRRGKAHYYNDNQNNKNKNKRTLQRKKAQVYLGFFFMLRLSLFRFDRLQIMSDVGALRFWDNALRFDKAFSLKQVSGSRRQIFLWLIAIR